MKDGYIKVAAVTPQVTVADVKENTKEILKVIRQLASEHMTMVIVTHEMAFARDVSTRTIFMDQGYIVEDAPPAELFKNPKNARTREFLSRYLAG